MTKRYSYKAHVFRLENGFLCFSHAPVILLTLMIAEEVDLNGYIYPFFFQNMFYAFLQTKFPNSIHPRLRLKAFPTAVCTGHRQALADMRQKGKFRKLGFPTLTLGSRYYLSQLVCHVTETRACKHRWLWLIVWLGRNQADASFRKRRPPISIVGFKRFINRREANLYNREPVQNRIIQSQLKIPSSNRYVSCFKKACPNTRFIIYLIQSTAWWHYLSIRYNFLGLADDIYLLQSILFQRFILFSDYPKAKLFSVILYNGFIFDIFSSKMF